MKIATTTTTTRINRECSLKYNLLFKEKKSIVVKELFHCNLYNIHTLHLFLYLYITLH